MRRVQAAGAVAAQVVGSVDEAKHAADSGFELIVAQGSDAGGHVRGSSSTMVLTPQVVDAVGPLPVIAAGGIADRRGVTAAFSLGAEGVWAGTCFLASVEADIHETYQHRVLAAGEHDAIYSRLFDIDWPDAPMRTLRNSTIDAWERAGQPDSPHRPNEQETVAWRGSGATIPRYHSSAPVRDMRGNIEAMALYAGAAAALVRAVQPASTIVEELALGLPPEGRERSAKQVA